MRKFLKSFNLAEWLIWGVSVVAVVVSFFVFKNDQYHYLAGSLIGFTALIFVSKGNPIGQILTIVFSVFYGIISYSFSYFGEMITYLGMSTPMAVAALIAWFRNPYNGNRSQVKVNNLSKKEWALFLLSAVAVTVAFYFILGALNTANLIISTVSVFTSFIAAYLNMRRSKYYAIAYAFNDIVLIVMWVMASIESLTYLPMVICFAAFMALDIYGFINWSIIEKRQKNFSKEKNMIYEKKGLIDSGHIGADTNLSVAGAFRIVENSVTEMMAQLKIDGITVKKLYNAMWVFAKNRIKFLKPLPWGENFTAECFITSFSLVKLNVETAIRNEKNEIAAYAKTELCALDLETGKIKKTSAVGLDESFVKHPSLMELEFAKFEDAPLPLAESVTVRSTNIDFSRHTNNVEYVRFLLNTYSVDELLNSPVKEIEVCYVSQSYENDELQIYKSAGDSKDVIIIKKADTTVIKCEILH